MVALAVPPIGPPVTESFDAALPDGRIGDPAADGVAPTAGVGGVGVAADFPLPPHALKANRAARQLNIDTTLFIDHLQLEEIRPSAPEANDRFPMP
jgi:hypothetical protein